MIETARLTLRGPGPEDWPAWRDFYRDAAAAAFYGGPLAPDASWRRLAADIGHWHLRGHGVWALVERASGVTVGACGLVWPEGWPRSELTWWIASSARRLGYAREASAAAIDFGHDALGWPVVETHFRDENIPARRLVERLGGTRLTRETFPDGIARDVFALPREA